jgi:hypothetical protein
MKEELAIFNNWSTVFNQEFALKLLDLWLDRCLFRHALVFFQFRKMLKNASFT